MQLASAWLILDKHGSNTPIKGVTPAELVILIRDRQDFIGKQPVHNLVITGQSKRTDIMERQRLREKYGKALPDRKVFKVNLLYPGEGNNLPQTFEELGAMYTDSCKDLLEEVKAAIPDLGDSELEKLTQLEESEAPVS